MTRFRKDDQEVVLSLEDEGRVLRVERHGAGVPEVTESGFNSPVRARWEHDLTAKRLGDEGYARVAAEPAAPAVDAAELEQLLSQGDRLDLETALVYADFLSVADDPRGELVVLQQRIAEKNEARVRKWRRPDEEHAGLLRRETELLFAHRNRLLGELGTRLLDEGRQRYAIDELRIGWWLGFFESVHLRRVEHEHRQVESPVSVSTLLELIARCPSARFLRRLEVRPLLDEDRLDAIDALGRVAFPTSLRTIIFGGAVDGYGRDVVETPTPFAAFGDLLDRLPNLHTLELDGPQPTDPARHAHLRSLSLRARYLTPEVVAAIASSEWPALEHLTFGGRLEVREDAMRIADALVPLLEGQSAPRLTSLRLEAIVPAQPVIERILGSSFVANASGLTLTDSHVDQALAKTLLAASSKLGTLALDLSHNQMADIDRRALRERFPRAKIAVRGQAGPYPTDEDLLGPEYADLL